MDRETNRRVKMERSAPYPAVTWGVGGGRVITSAAMTEEEEGKGKGILAARVKTFCKRGGGKEKKSFPNKKSSIRFDARFILVCRVIEQHGAIFAWLFFIRIVCVKRV